MNERRKKIEKKRTPPKYPNHNLSFYSILNDYWSHVVPNGIDVCRVEDVIVTSGRNVGKKIKDMLEPGMKAIHFSLDFEKWDKY